MMDLDQQQSQLKLLIAKGKDQGYLTYHEVNDHLPEGIVDPEQIEDIISMINDMGITVHEVPPDADSLLMMDNAVSTDEDAAEEAAAALATLDSEFGRTTDPVRMYMREMGTVDLLTREGEIRIAKRIEKGLIQAMGALASFPPTVGTLLDIYTRVDAEELKLTDMLTAFIDPNDTDQVVPPPRPPDGALAQGASNDDEDEELLNTGPDPEEAKARFKKLKRAYTRLCKASDTHGLDAKQVEKIRGEFSEQCLEFKLVPKLVDRLTADLREVVARIRSHERTIMAICVKDAHMPKKDFIKLFPANETNLNWVRSHTSKKDPLRCRAEAVRRRHQTPSTQTRRARKSL